MTTKLKVYELAKELGVEAQHLVEVIQRIGVDVKNSMSVLGTEEVRNVREYYRKQIPSQSIPTPSKSTVSEKRVGAKIIRRRAAPESLVTAPQSQKSSAELSSPSPESLQQSNPLQEITEEPESIPAPLEEAVSVESVEPESSKPKKFFPSIIKKVATEEYLGEKIGPKLEKARPKATVPVAEPSKPTEPQPLGALKRVKEINLTASNVEQATKPTGRRRLLEGQGKVFKSADYLKRELIHATRKKKVTMNRPLLKTKITQPSEHKRIVTMGTSLTVGELSKEMGQKASVVVAKLLGMGVTAGINDSIDFDTASLVAHEFGYEIHQEVFREEDFLPKVDLQQGEIKPRHPVVTIMGHVDHGKTSLLDAIRKSRVAQGEAGGITQHIGAYTINLPKGRITFLDTPGHEAFTAMRARGAKVTDIVILVVSAVDGVMPQTLESVNHAEAANVPLIVAVNKTDLPEAQGERIKQTLAGHKLAPEEWGGQTIYVNVSAKTGKGINELLEAVLLQTEMLELKANYSVPARGTVIESKLDKGRGVVTTILVQQGVLHAGDIITCGVSYGKIKAMNNADGKRVNEGFPSEPVEVLGLSQVPVVGDEVVCVADEKTARDLAEARGLVNRDKLEARPKMTVETLLAGEGREKELRLLLKADVQGSVEALKEVILKQPTDKIKIRLLHYGTGGISESDVMLAAASGGIILGFGIRPEVKVQKLAEQENVTIRTYNIIYELLDDLKRIMEGMVDKVLKEKVIGRAEVRNVFHIPRVGTVAGSAVIDGKVQRGCFLRLLRDSRVVYEGKISSLKRFKDDVKEVQSGFECGIGLENFNDLKLGDQFEAFIKEEVPVSL